MGVISGLYISPGQYMVVITLVTIVSGFAVSLFFNTRIINIIYGISLTASFFVIGLLLYSNSKNSISELKQKPSLFKCTLSDYPEEKKNSVQLLAELNYHVTDTGLIPLRGSVIMYLRKNEKQLNFLPGDELIVKFAPAAIENRRNPYEFNYKFYLENRGIRYQASINEQDILFHRKPEKRNLIFSSLIIREKIIRMYRERGVREERLGLASAITLGQKRMLDPDQRMNFINAGIMHIMAVSGLHAMILSMFILKILFFLKGRLNPVRVITAILIIWLFVFITGSSPSVVRAALMFSFLQAGNLMKRKVNPVNSVLASAFVLILIRPTVIFDSGFLLSYSAVIFIIVFYRDFHNLIYPANRIADWIWQSVSVTLIAQAGTLPLTIAFFNRFPTYFILTNIVIVPVSSLVIIAGCLVPATYPFPLLSGYVASGLDFLTGITGELTSRASSLPYSSIDNIGMTGTGCLLLTMLIFLSIHRMLRKEPAPAFLFFTVLFIFVLSDTLKELTTRKSNEIIVYNTNGPPVVGIRTGRIMNIFSASGAVSPEALRHCTTLGLRIVQDSSGSPNVYLKAGMTGIEIMNQGRDDLITVVRTINDNIGEMTSGWNGGSLPGRRPEQLYVIVLNHQSVRKLPEKIIRDPSCNLHIIRKSGAYRMRL
jgi:competence protein ComEC